MFNFVIRFLGIIIIAVEASNSHYLRVLIPDGSTQHKISQTENKFTMIHGSFIRIRGHSAQIGSYWPGSRACIEGTPCFVYPLAQGDVISIHGISDSEDGIENQFKPQIDVEWSQLDKTLKLKADAEAFAAGSMNIRAGVVVSHFLPSSNMVITTGTFKLPSSIVTIEVTGKKDANGNAKNKRLILPVDTGVDFVNLPPMSALSVIGGNHADADETHFCLHYTLAETPPVTCEPPPGITRTRKGGLDGSIKCSNSNYP